jgi:hypothetical protein
MNARIDQCYEESLDANGRVQFKPAFAAAMRRSYALMGVPEGGWQRNAIDEAIGLGRGFDSASDCDGREARDRLLYEAYKALRQSPSARRDPTLPPASTGTEDGKSRSEAIYESYKKLRCPAIATSCASCRSENTRAEDFGHGGTILICTDCGAVEMKEDQHVRHQ